MADILVPRKELEFQLHEVLDVESLCQYERFEEHNKDTFNATLDTAEKIAEELFLPHNATADKDEPKFDGEKVSMIPEVKTAFDAFCEAGFIAGRYDFEEGGIAAVPY